MKDSVDTATDDGQSNKMARQPRKKTHTETSPSFSSRTECRDDKPREREKRRDSTVQVSQFTHAHAPCPMPTGDIINLTCDISEKPTAVKPGRSDDGNRKPSAKVNKKPSKKPRCHGSNPVGSGSAAGAGIVIAPGESQPQEARPARAARAAKVIAASSMKAQPGRRRATPTTTNTWTSRPPGKKKKGARKGGATSSSAKKAGKKKSDSDDDEYVEGGAAPGPGMGRKGMSREHEAKPVPGKKYLQRKDGSRVQSRSTKGWDNNGKYIANIERYGRGNLNRMQKDRRVQHAEQDGFIGQLVIPAKIHEMAREDDDVNFGVYNGNKMVVMKLAAFERFSGSVIFVHMKVDGTETENKYFDSLSDYAKLTLTLNQFDIGLPVGQKTYAGNWVKPVIRHGKVYFFHEQFHANGNAAQIRKNLKTTHRDLAKKIAYEDTLNTRAGKDELDVLTAQPAWPWWFGFIYYPLVLFVLMVLSCVSCRDPGLMERVTDEEAADADWFWNEQVGSYRPAK
ncbi:hypothetical protein THAOC_11626, partial [Thalassiosira oceanica]